MRRTEPGIAAIVALTLTIPLSRATAQSSETTGSTATYAEQSTFTAPAIAATRFDPADWGPQDGPRSHRTTRATLARSAPLFVSTAALVLRMRAARSSEAGVAAAAVTQADEPTARPVAPAEPRATPIPLDLQETAIPGATRPTSVTELAADASTTAPEPSTFVLVVAGLGGLGLAEIARRRAHRPVPACLGTRRRGRCEGAELASPHRRPRIARPPRLP